MQPLLDDEIEILCGNIPTFYENYTIFEKLKSVFLETFKILYIFSIRL